MSLIELFLLAAGLSMDAFAVSVCKGLSMQKMRAKHALVIGLYFGGFQALMPWIGYMLGIRFQGAIKAYDHWIAFILLGIIGFNMVKESMDNETESCDASIDVKTMLILAIATSIDALAVGVTFAFLDVRILQAVSFIGCTTFILSVIGVKVGTVFGVLYKSKAERTGGIILILIGLKILIEHLFFSRTGTLFFFVLLVLFTHVYPVTFFPYCATFCYTFFPDYGIIFWYFYYERKVSLC